MSTVIVLDTGPLGLVTNPRAEGENLRCSLWMTDLLSRGVQFVLPEIADYELRRELIRANKQRGLERLDGLKSTIEYAPITTRAMLSAAEFWAAARARGQATADDLSLDADVILAAQATVLERQPEDDVIIATTNVGHLSRFARAEHWTAIVA